MEIVISKNYESLSLNAAASIELKMQSKTNPLICVASGDTPSGVYQQIVARVKAGQLNISNWHFLGLDEWVGMNGSNEGSCRHYLDQALFHPLSIPEKSICFFDGCASNLEKECIKSENTIEEKSGIEIAILGLGMNGHIGMNEPNTSKQTRSHIVDLDPLTIAVGQKYFSQPQALSKGITLGLATLLEAKHVQLLVSGAKKASIVKALVEGPIHESLPGSLLKTHPNCTLYLDEAAASELS